jgi:hypothetical protein
MAYFIFLNNKDNIDGTLYRIAENQNDLNDLNIVLSDYKIIEDSQVFFDAVKYGTKNIIKYNNNLIISEDLEVKYINSVDKDGKIILFAKQLLSIDISVCKESINVFLKNDKNHPQFEKWNSYYNQLNSLDLDSIQFPLNCSLEQYFKNQGLVSLNPLQLP